MLLSYVGGEEFPSSLGREENESFSFGRRETLKVT